MENTTLCKLLLIAITGFGIQSNIHGANIESQDTDSIKQKPSKITFYVDGVIVPEEVIKEAAKKEERNTLKGYAGALEPRDAIRVFGEKLRNGVMFFKSPQKKDDETKN